MISQKTGRKGRKAGRQARRKGGSEGGREEGERGKRESSKWLNNMAIKNINLVQILSLMLIKNVTLGKLIDLYVTYFFICKMGDSSDICLIELS